MRMLPFLDPEGDEVYIDCDAVVKISKVIPDRPGYSELSLLNGASQVVRGTRKEVAETVQGEKHE